MISVLTLTYRRPDLLEEAIYSFLVQKDISFPVEMVVVNDDSCELMLDKYPNNIRIINYPQRFDYLSYKLKYGFAQCKYPYIYRLDDDDLLVPTALSTVAKEITAHPGYDIYRSKSHHFFTGNNYTGKFRNVNTGNIYSREYIERIEFLPLNVGEDTDITYHQEAKRHEFNETTMIYRWGTGHYHISAYIDAQDMALESVERAAPSVGEKELVIRPKLRKSYFSELS